MENKVGGIWISAVLYMALGILIISMILAVGLPAVQKMKDRFTLTQTQDLMLVLDENIRSVYQDVGSQRTMDIKINRGIFEIDSDNDRIVWSLTSSISRSEPDIVIDEGSLSILTQSTNVKGSYEVIFTLDYDGLLELTYSENQPILSGNSRISILNKGAIIGGSLPELSITKL